MLYDPSNAHGASVYDVEARQKIARVVRVNTDTGEVVALREASNKWGYVLDEEVHRFQSIYPIFGGRTTPVLFHCYGRIQ